MEFLIVCLVALVASGLTLFSGFGLGTLLLPAFLLFFSGELAVAMTAIVHFLNNLLKLVLLGRHANVQVVIRFGIPAMAAAFAGAAVLFLFSDLQPVAAYTIGERAFFITPMKLTMAFLIVVFALIEIFPLTRRIEFDRKLLPLGGLLSGFFGGLSGHQGALRSAFLLRSGFTKESFIATGVVIACLIDIIRLSVYTEQLAATGLQENVWLLAAAVLSAFTGVFFGRKLLPKVTMPYLGRLVSVMLLLIALLLGLGLV